VVSAEAAGPVVDNCAWMPSYAVLWQAEGTQPASGRLEFDTQGLFLRGCRRGHEVRVEVPYDEIIAANRDARRGSATRRRFGSKAAPQAHY
jgi:hypothetical protein